MQNPIQILIFGFLIAAGAPAVSLADPTRDIEVSVERLETALNAGDLDALALLYAPGAVIIPSGSEILDNPAAIRSFWQDQFASGADAYRLDILDARVDGDRAYLSTLWSATVNTRGDRVVTFDGNLSSVLVHQADGSWKFSMQGWN